MPPGIHTGKNNAVPLVSIIIPLYNSEKFVAASVQSALDQTWPNKEVIVIDDGSSDGSYTAARHFESGMVQVHTQPNQGSCATRNAGFTYSKGSYIQYLDADDLLSAGKIEEQMKVLQQCPAGSVASCPWGRFEQKPEDTVFIREKVWKDMQPADWLLTAWQGGGMMQTACWLTPRHLIEQAGPWNESLKQNPIDDGEFFCRVLLQSSGIKYCDSASVYYRTHTGGRVSGFSNRQAVQSVLDTYVSYEEHIKLHVMSPAVIQSLARNYALFMYLYYNRFYDLACMAEQRIKQLGTKKIPPVGGKYFNTGAALIGFKPMLKLRSIMKNFRTVQAGHTVQ